MIKDIKDRLPGCIVLKNDANYIQGIPDLLILYGDRWAALEVKRSLNASHRPNQDHFVQMMNKMSFAKFISPQNKEKILHELESTFRSGRNSRIS